MYLPVLAVLSRESRPDFGILVDMTARMTSPAAPVAEPVEETLPATETEANLPWVCICWDDPVNLMSYVTYVFQTVLGYSRKKATALMMEVHTQGKAVVSSGDRDKVEADVKKLHTAGLWATMEQTKG